jgi:hypothetical protein
MDLVKKLEDEEKSYNEKVQPNKNLNSLFESFNLEPTTSNSDSLIAQSNLNDILKEFHESLDDYSSFK